MISEQEAIDNLNNASIEDHALMNQDLNENVLIATMEPVGAEGISPDQRTETTEFLNSISWNNDLTINDHLTGVAMAGRKPCD